MRIPHLRLAVLAVASGIALGGCAYGYDPYGYGGGYGGYGGLSVGYGYPGYGYGYSPYGYGSYGGFGYGSPFGWYGDFYYPGTGIYVYDRHRHRHVWNDTQRRHWSDRNGHWRDHSGTTGTTTTTSITPRENWSGFDRPRYSSGMTTTRTYSRSSSDSGTRTRGSWRQHSDSSTDSDDHRRGRPNR